MTDTIIGFVLELVVLVAVLFGGIYLTVTRPLMALLLELREIRQALYSLELNKSDRNIKSISR